MNAVRTQAMPKRDQVWVGWRYNRGQAICGVCLNTAKVGFKSRYVRSRREESPSLLFGLHDLRHQPMPPPLPLLSGLECRAKRCVVRALLLFVALGTEGVYMYMYMYYVYRSSCYS
jgi:hypothetical protein